jgi:hypothetical protein
VIRTYGSGKHPKYGVSRALEVREGRARKYGGTKTGKYF